MEDNDVQLQLKKRARRRLVGAVAFAGFAAVVLPMIMDQEPKQPAQDVEIRIPGQDEKPFAPRFATAPAAKPAEAKIVDGGDKAAALPADKVAAKATEKPLEKTAEKGVEKAADKAQEKAAPAAASVVAKPAEKAPEKVAEKPTVKAAEKTPEKAAVKAPEKAPEKSPAKVEKAEKAAGTDSRAAAILAGKAPEAVSAQHVILIGAFNNAANVKNLQSKLGELGIKVYTESLDTPQGKKIRVRAGPFASRDAGEKALEKMKRIGVSGVLTAKQ